MPLNSVRDWLTTAASNTDVGGTSIAEGCNPGNINDGMREMMAQTAAWYKDTNGTLTSAGTADALTLTTNETITAYAAGNVFVFKAGTTNTGAATINVDSLGTKAIEINDAALSAGDITADKFYSLLYDGTAFQLTRLSAAAGAFQPLDADLTAIAGLTSAANKIPMFDGSESATLIDRLDEDDMSSDSATGVPTQQSVKAYVDNNAGNGWVLLSAQTISAAATVDFDSLLTSTYDQYMLVINRAIPATDDREAWLRVEQSSTYVSTSGAYQYAVAAVDAAAATTNTATGSGSDTEMVICLTGGNQAVGNGSDEGFDAVIYIASPSSTAVKKKIHGTCSYSRPQDGGLIMGNLGGQFIANTNAITGIQFLFESGNITSGEFNLYGLKNT